MAAVTISLIFHIFFSNSTGSDAESAASDADSVAPDADSGASDAASGASDVVFPKVLLIQPFPSFLFASCSLHFAVFC